MFSNLNSQRRTHESPMDWEWQNQAPVDPNTPFPQYKPQQGQPKPNFQSPVRSAKPFANTPVKTAPPFRNPSFTTPRRAFDPDLFSEASGAESSPADTIGGDDTPEPDIQKISAGMAVLQSPTHKTPLFGKYGAGFLGSSPGRGERRGAKISTALTHKLRKRKRVKQDVKMFGGLSDSDSDEGDSRPSSKKGGKAEQEKKEHWFGSFMSGIESRPGLPYTLSEYIQVGFNLLFLFLTVFGIYTFWSAVKEDITNASNIEISIAQESIAQCARDYVNNRCGPDQRVEALRKVCADWDVCMRRDAQAVGRARVSAHTFAEIVNSFVEPISYKTMIFVILTITGVLAANNIAFGAFRSKLSAPHIPQQHAPPPTYFPPPTPQHTYQWGAPPQTPQHNTHFFNYEHEQSVKQIMPSFTPGQRSPSKGQRSPSRGRIGRSPSKQY
ncbi:hypothetical protein HYFRA_00001954 [Hymenoscyphus fraxineus]|uniref:Brl1/Brr6 domain-containing protein n=1 Tax=Hymenoscyphus fraxineus TaxID=746836 RepID=A0A9N9PJN5_9HELO|nr:hypothetical protein HYFRA_00001954 [Hymenoscyphus fraxineus]